MDLYLCHSQAIVRQDGVFSPPAYFEQETVYVVDIGLVDASEHELAHLTMELRLLSHQAIGETPTGLELEGQTLGVVEHAACLTVYPNGGLLPATLT